MTGSKGLALFFAIIFALALFSAPKAYSQSIDDASEGAIELPDEEPSAYPEKEATPTGRKAAEKYMAPRKSTRSRNISGVGSGGGGGSRGGGDHFLAVHLGMMVTDNAYKWGGRDSSGNVGKWNAGVTYRVGEWVNSMDLNVRIDVQRFQLDEGNATKLSFLPVITFPDASSKFPLYFGIGAGLGVFAQQISNESALAFDYQLIAGARFFDIFDNTGFFVEAGMKNHAHLLSDGQFNGSFVALGAVFTF